jgi:glycosyltransferase involved in cell wall biosynthesis
MEASALSAADHITYQSPTVLPKLNDAFFDVSSKATLVMNGFDASMNFARPTASPKARELTIGYFGAISDSPSSYRNPTAFLEAVAEAEAPIRVVFYGDIRLRAHWYTRLADRFQVHDNLPHDDALAKMAEIDILLLLHSQKEGSDEVIPGKLFEYMLAQRPILVLGPTPMEAKRIVSEEGIGYTADASNAEAIGKTLKTLHSEWLRGKLPTVDKEQLLPYSRQTQFRKMLPLFS